MRGVTITDSTEDGHFFAFDLIDILRALGSAAVNSEWELFAVESTGAAADTLHQLADNEERVAGACLLELAANVIQIFEGEFIGYWPNQDQPWVIICAVDGAAYDVESEGERVLARMREHFEYVIDIPSDDEWIAQSNNGQKGWAEAERLMVA